MKNVILLLALTLFSFSATAQQQYDINGKTYELKTEVEGELDLLWNITSKQYHYFVKTSDGTILELLNSKGTNNKYQEEYKSLLRSLTKNVNDIINTLNFTLHDFEVFFKSYNTLVGNSVYNEKHTTLKTRLAFYGGITNQPFILNFGNITVPFFGSELEFISSDEITKHAGFFSVEHALDHDDFKYSSTQLALGYRYRFINKSSFNIYGNVQFATLTFSKNTVELTSTTTEVVKNSTFKIPLIFGLGADIKISDCSFITLAYNKLFALLIDNNSNFPVNFTIGYKFNL